MFYTIPTERPNTPLLDTINAPSDLRRLSLNELDQLVDDLRHFLLYSVGQTGGHLGAGLGVIELTVALHYCFDTPDDHLVWDVGHQTYPHKILTGRREQMATLRTKEGIAPFPSRDESPYDTFGVGHSSTSISAALGMALAKKARGTTSKTVAVIGDGAMTAGMAFEALNHAGSVDADMLVILNDNAMSISENVGGLASYFARILSSRFYLNVRQGGKKILSHLPSAQNFARKTEEHMKGMVVPGTLFDELGLNYIGPIDGHDLKALITALTNIKDQKGPQFLHLVTQKGKGFEPAEASPIGTHSMSKIETNPIGRNDKRPSYANIFGQWICDKAATDTNLMAITPAMREGSDLVAFSERFADRYFDVAIAEQHAVTLAAGLACQGMKPVVAIYSTFLQRAYDQLIHDIAIQNLDVLFAIDRAGLLEDGPTHSGVFDYGFLRCIPNVVVMAPSDESELKAMLEFGYEHPGPACVRYPRGEITGAGTEAPVQIELGRGEVRRSGQEIAILAFGSMLQTGLEVAEPLGATVVDMRFVKPLDEALITQLAREHGFIVTLEENAVQGGAGSAVNEHLAKAGYRGLLLNLGIPDEFIQPEKPSQMIKASGLDAASVLHSINAHQTAFGN
ncbi:MAG: 1-deoxy-D-xylulose-5-phosphate synthase [Pseudomonadales bacterium]|jgi:1-deoxy-D-xylulose-5-phosphate synthase|tara:strand:- start:1110 stop:2981 length:1872 start_codon:yes stop_codon:yes gene_type:complete